MRKILVITALVCSLSPKAQIQVYLSGGTNNTQIRATGSPDGISQGNNSKWQWQMGASVILPAAGDIFLYTGLQYEAKAFHEAMDICCVVMRDVSYHPKYINLPVGVGYQLRVLKNTSLQFSAGGYVSMGAGGRMEGMVQRNDLPISGGLFMSPYFNRKISFGADADIKRWRWGLESGISANWKKIVLQFHYQIDISNSEHENSYREFQYSTTRFDLGYRLFNFKK
ncbi:MAG: outer membrane beta-barrel protein [Bacteroidota bacterium]